MKHLLTKLVTGVALIAMLVACTTDDYEPSYGNSELWQGELSAAPYAKDAVCLVPTGAQIENRTINYIELSSSGLYFITYLENGAHYRPQGFHRPKPETRDWMPYESVISGDFKVLGPNHYDLTGFGEMTINSDGTIDLKLTEGETYIWPVTKVDKIDDNRLNSRICRTWDLIDGRIDFLNSDMKVIYSLDIPSSVMKEDYIYCITFTSAGRAYRKDYEDDFWYGADWRWSDVSAQLVMLTSDDPEDGDGIFQVLFDNDRMLVMNPWDFDDGDEARWEFSNIPGIENIPYDVRYAREYINMKAMN